MLYTLHFFSHDNSHGSILNFLEHLKIRTKFDTRCSNNMLLKYRVKYKRGIYKGIPKILPQRLAMN